MKTLSTVAALVVLAAAGQAHARETTGTVALGYQSLGFADGMRAVDLRLWVTDQLALQPAVGLKINDDVTEVNVGGRVLINLLSTDRVDYHLSGDIGIHVLDDDNQPDTLTDVGLRVMIGPEYFLTSRLSVQGDVGVGLTIYDSDGLDMTQLDTFGDLGGTVGVHYYLF